MREAKYKQNSEILKKDQERKIRKENLEDLATQASFLRMSSIRSKSVPRSLSASAPASTRHKSDSDSDEKIEANENVSVFLSLSHIIFVFSHFLFFLRLVFAHYRESRRKKSLMNSKRRSKISRRDKRRIRNGRQEMIE